MNSFWHTLPKPFFALAPLADVTDPAFRKLIAETGKPDITWTEFVSADGLFATREKRRPGGSIIYDTDAANPLIRDLTFTQGEHPILAQFFTSNPETMEYAACYAKEHGFDGVDINMGCPDKSIEKQGAGASHIKDPSKAVEVIRAALRGADGLPVSVKTRIGYNKIEYETWLPHLLTSGISALTIHLRTRKEMSKVNAHWEFADEIVSFCRKINPNVLLLGNGDVKNITEAHEKAVRHGFDGIMLGRAIFGNPWLFTNRATEEMTPAEKLQALRTLAQYFDELRPKKHFAILKKHFKAFVSGWPDAAVLRARLMDAGSLKELESVITEAAV